MVQKKSKKVLIIFSDFYPEISENLINGAELYLQSNNILFDKIRVDGSLEIPFVLHKFQNEYSGFVVLGCIVRGETDHYDVVKNISMNEIYSLVYKRVLPLGSAILTVNNLQQALERSDTKKKNFGGKAAMVCCNLIKILKS
tara:strand:- start:410 stop:835 length:426 start_codon:yes stop_codon:yes gene_type:complete